MIDVGNGQVYVDTAELPDPYAVAHGSSVGAKNVKKGKVDSNLRIVKSQASEPDSDSPSARSSSEEDSSQEDSDSEHEGWARCG